MTKDAKNPAKPRTRWRPRRNPQTITPGRPFMRIDFDASSESAWALRGRYRRLFRGVYVPKDVELTTELLAEGALLLAGPHCFVSHHTAALLWGASVPDHPDVHVTYRGPRAQCFGIFAHRAKGGQKVTSRRGLRLTTALQTFLDLAHVLNLVDLVVLGDSLVRRKRFTPAELVRFVANARGPYSRHARRAASLVRAGVDSPMETRTRLLIVLAGLPEPTINHTIFRPDGTVLRRFDLAYVEARLAIEYDGRQHAESTEQWHGDIARDEQLDDWRVRRLVVVSTDIFATPGNTLLRITKAMRERGMSVPPLKDEWQRHFPSRAGDIRFASA